MKYVISKDHTFSASHVLAGLPAGHQCGRMHGHNYLIRLALGGDRLDGRGFVIDYGDLAPFFALVDEQLDHRHLNDVLVENPTAENLAEWLYVKAREFGWPVVSVAVSETPKSWATYTPSHGDLDPFWSSHG